MNMAITSKPTVLKWTKKGWIKHQKEVQSGLRAKVPYAQDRLDEEGLISKGEMYIIQDLHNNIQYGPIGHLIDELPGPLAEIMQMPSLWHISNTKLFKVMDPESQVYETGNWGTDKSDVDIDSFEDSSSVTRRFLEDSGVLAPESSSSITCDILGSIADGHEVFNDARRIRADIDISMLAANEDGNQIYPAFYSRDKVSLPSINIPEAVKREVLTTQQDYQEKIANSKSKKEKDLLHLILEQKIDSLLNVYLTCSLNSPYCGHQYSPPKPNYIFIDTPRNSSIKTAAEERQLLFSQLFGKATACSSLNDLYGKLVADKRKEISGNLNPNYNKLHRPGGFLGEIRGMYSHDKALGKRWSINDWTDKEGNIHLSALTIERNNFIRNYRDEQLGDEESLRLKVWNQFDKEAKIIPAIYDKKTKKLLKPTKRYKDSWWRRKRTTALEELFLTRAQWNSIYEMVEIVKTRIKLLRQPTKERKESLNKLAEVFPQISSLRDLQDYMQFATTRKIKDDGHIKKSLVDQISFLDEHRWRMSCAKKRRHLISRLVLYTQMEKQVISCQQTNLPEISLPCPDPKCDCMAIGSPMWFELEEDKGIHGIRCDGCNKIVWDLNHRETPTPKRLDCLRSS